MTYFLTAVRHEVNNLESSIVVQELEFAINRALYGLFSRQAAERWKNIINIANKEKRPKFNGRSSIDRHHPYFSF